MINHLSLISKLFVGWCGWFICLYNVLWLKQASFFRLYQDKSGASKIKLQCSSTEFALSRLPLDVTPTAIDFLGVLLLFIWTSSYGGDACYPEPEGKVVPVKGKWQFQIFFSFSKQFLWWCLYLTFFIAGAFFLMTLKCLLRFIFETLTVLTE